VKIYLQTDSGKHWLAGHDLLPECERSSVSGYVHQGSALIQGNEYLRGNEGRFYDRANFTCEISFSAKRTFDTSGEAFLFVLDYDRTAPRDGDVFLVIDNPYEHDGEELRVIPDAVVEPPTMGIIGCTVDMTFKIHGGEVADVAYTAGVLTITGGVLDGLITEELTESMTVGSTTINISNQSTGTDILYPVYLQPLSAENAITSLKEWINGEAPSVPSVQFLTASSNPSVTASAAGQVLTVTSSSIGSTKTEPLSETLVNGSWGTGTLV